MIFGFNVTLKVSLDSMFKNRNKPKDHVCSLIGFKKVLEFFFDFQLISSSNIKVLGRYH